MDFNWGHACDVIKLKLTMKRLHSYKLVHIKYFLYMHVHATSSERSCCFNKLIVSTQNGYVAEGTRNQTTLNHRGYSVALTLYAW